MYFKKDRNIQTIFTYSTNRLKKKHERRNHQSPEMYASNLAYTLKNFGKFLYE